MQSRKEYFRGGDPIHLHASLMSQASCALIPSMLHVAKDSSHPLNVEQLLITLLTHTTRLEMDEQTEWDQLSNHIKSFSDCVRVISIPLPLPLLDGFLNCLSRTVGIVAECMELDREDGDEEDDSERENWEWGVLLGRVEEALGVVVSLEGQREGGGGEGLKGRWEGVLGVVRQLKEILNARQ